MKGFSCNIKGQKIDYSPCFFCKHRETLTVEKYCYNCISNVDLALHKVDSKTNYLHFEPRSDCSFQRIDLCPECYESFINWLESGGEE